MNKPKPMPSYWALAEEVTHLHGMLDKYKNNNVKLRELVMDMYGNYRTGWNEEIEEELYNRMLELGVVDA